MRAGLLPMTLVAIFSSAALADAAPLDGDDTKDGGAAQTADDGGLLAGPKVEEEPADADNPAFGGEDRMRQTIDVPPARWFGILRDVELTEAQRTQAVAIAMEYQEVSRKFRKENAGALRELQERIKKSRAENDFDPKLRELNREIQSGAPEAQPYQDRIWSLLDAAQQETFKAKLEEVRKEIAARRAQDRDDRLDTRRRGGRDGDAEMESRDAGVMDDGGENQARPPMRRGGGARSEGVWQGWRAGQGLDAMGQKRFDFLMSKRSKHAAERGGALERVRERDPAAPSEPMD
jgi:hypothetical protein